MNEKLYQLKRHFPGFVDTGSKVDYGVHTKENAIKLAEKISKEFTPDVSLTWEEESKGSRSTVSVWGMSQENFVIWKLKEVK